MFTFRSSRQDLRCSLATSDSSFFIGTGKTLLVRALAREAGCRMLVISPSDVMDMYVGEGMPALFSVNHNTKL